MSLHALAAAAALASPLIGHQTADVNGEPVDRPFTFVNRTTLRRVAETPVLPHATAEFSPDGKRYVVPGNGELAFYRTDGGRRLGTIPDDSNGTLSWIAPRRLLVIGFDEDPSSTVRVLDPVSRRVVRTVRFAPDDFFLGTSRLGDRQLLFYRHQTSPQSLSVARVLILDEDGRVRHRRTLPNIDGVLRGRVVAGADTRIVDGPHRLHVYAVDPLTGRLRSRTLKGLSQSLGRFLPGTTSPSLFEVADRYVFLSPRTGAVLRRFGKDDDPGYAFGAPGGYVSVSFAKTVARAVSGKVRWRRDNPGDGSRKHRLQTRVFGHRIYQQFHADGEGERSFLRILSLETGKTINTIPGEWQLRPLTRGNDPSQTETLGH